MTRGLIFKECRSVDVAEHVAVVAGGAEAGEYVAVFNFEGEVLDVEQTLCLMVDAEDVALGHGAGCGDEFETIPKKYFGALKLST